MHCTVTRAVGEAQGGKTACDRKNPCEKSLRGNGLAQGKAPHVQMQPGDGKSPRLEKAQERKSFLGKKEENLRCSMGPASSKTITGSTLKAQ